MNLILVVVDRNLSENLWSLDLDLAGCLIEACLEREVLTDLLV